VLVRIVSSSFLLVFLQSSIHFLNNMYFLPDEINQGLDERNERLVFRRIVENSCKEPKATPTDHSGQYFLITPKLLPNLMDMEEEQLTVLFVTNGPFNFSNPTEWNVSHMVALANQEAASDKAAYSEDQENSRSGNTMHKPTSRKRTRLS